MRKISMVVAAAFVFVVHSAYAGDPTMLFGKWIEKHNNGAMVWEFTPTTISSTPVDASGTPTRAAIKSEVTYQELNHEKGTYGINFKNKDGKPGGGIMVTINNPNYALVDFPGMGTHMLSRAQ